MGFAFCVGNAPVISMELRLVRRSKCDNNAALALPQTIPIYISTLKKDINLEELRHLYSHCNHSCNRLSENAEKKTVDMKKLRTAISRSDVLVSVFCKSRHANLENDESSLGDMFQDVLPLTPLNGRLVGFGRAYSDHGLTASIHDLLCLPGFTFTTTDGDRLLTSREIYDIAALCFEHERPFFKACGFGEDRMSSTTMMFTKKLET